MRLSLCASRCARTMRRSPSLSTCPRRCGEPGEVHRCLACRGSGGAVADSSVHTARTRSSTKGTVLSGTGASYYSLSPYENSPVEMRLTSAPSESSSSTLACRGAHVLTVSVHSTHAAAVGWCRRWRQLSPSPQDTPTLLARRHGVAPTFRMHRLHRASGRRRTRRIINILTGVAEQYAYGARWRGGQLLTRG